MPQFLPSRLSQARRSAALAGKHPGFKARLTPLAALCSVNVTNMLILGDCRVDGLHRPTVSPVPDGEVLCDRVHNAICETCRVLMSRGITGPFESWRAAIPYACGATSKGRRGLPWRREAPSLRGSEGGSHTPTLRMAFPVRAGQRQRARMTGG
jgi:hypothetical protein